MSQELTPRPPQAWAQTLSRARRIAPLLIVDDDQIFLARLGKAMEVRGYIVTSETSVSGRIGSDRQSPARLCCHRYCGWLMATAWM